MYHELLFKISLFVHQIKTIDTTVHTVEYHSCFTCEVNGFVQIRAVHSRAGPTTAFGQVVG